MISQYNQDSYIPDCNTNDNSEYRQLYFEGIYGLTNNG